MRYQSIDSKTIVEAVQFAPGHQLFLGLEIKPWPDEHSTKPRDGSWGYLERTGGSRIHIHIGDWILRESENNIFAARDQAFRAEFQPYTEPASSEDGHIRQIVREEIEAWWKGQRALPSIQAGARNYEVK